MIPGLHQPTYMNPLYRALARTVFATVLVIAPLTTSVQAAPASAPAPRLVLQITVDQLRGDMLPRYSNRLGKDGFRRLMDRGTWFTNAHYGTANTVTCSGHAVLVTGGDSAQHGMPANEWRDRKDPSRAVYCVSDPKVKIVGAQEGSGMSPANLSSTTVGDEMALVAGSRAFAVGGKDRSAIIPGGHLGKAFWYSEEAGVFVTSSFYMPELPQWVAEFNAGKPLDKYRKRSWAPLRNVESYRYAGGRENLNAHSPLTLGRTFPHSIDSGDHKEVVSMLRFTPMLDEYVGEFAKALIANEHLGQGADTDYLAVSLSSTDFIGHAFGPNTVEYEDNLIRLDALLESLFAWIDQRLGAGNTVVVLSADHGAGDTPEDLSKEHYDADRLPSAKPVVAAVNAYFQAQFNTTENLVAGYSPPALYLDAEAVRKAHLAQDEVEQALADYALEYIPGTAFAITRSDLMQGRLTQTPLMTRVQRAFHPERSGDVTLIQKQFWYLDADKDRYAATHGSPYSYDTFVPVLFYGPGIPARRVTRTVEPASIAPTLTALLGVRPPSGSIAPVLPEVLDAQASRTGRP